MVSSEARKRGGQPKPAEERKRNNLTFRARDDLKDNIRACAEAAGRSLSEEIEHRLELSVSRSDQIQFVLGKDIFRISQAMAMSLTSIEDWKGKSWVEDEEVFLLFQATTCELIRNYRDQVLKNKRALPRGNVEKMSPQERAQHFASLGGLSPPRPSADLIIIDEDS